MPKKQSKYPLVVVLGLDPMKEEIPMLLKHHVSKMTKDFPVMFLAKDDINVDTWKTVQEMVTKANFIAEPKKPISKIITS